MDLTKFDTKKASETGRFLHLEFDGEKLYEDLGEGRREPVGLTIKGPSSEEFTRRQRELRKQRQESIRVKGGKIKQSRVSDEEVWELYAACVTNYHHIAVDGRKFTDPANLEDSLLLFERFPFIREQVTEYVDDDSNWLGE